jgi:hypothetical protein
VANPESIFPSIQAAQWIPGLRVNFVSTARPGMTNGKARVPE